MSLPHVEDVSGFRWEHHDCTPAMPHGKLWHGNTVVLPSCTEHHARIYVAGYIAADVAGLKAALISSECERMKLSERIAELESRIDKTDYHSYFAYHYGF